MLLNKSFLLASNPILASWLGHRSPFPLATNQISSEPKDGLSCFSKSLSLGIIMASFLSCGTQFG
jgi:hypothetical protein